jgi:hypothetical protein
MINLWYFFDFKKLNYQEELEKDENIYGKER